MRFIRNKKSEAAFTLLEVMITLSILVTMVYAIAQMVRTGFDVKEALSQRAKVTHRFNVALEALAKDLTGAFIISTKDTTRDGNQKRTLFRITKGDSDSLAFTYVGHQAIRTNAKESDISFVKYEIRESKTEPGRKHLYRGESPRVPKDFKDSIPMFVLAEDVGSLKIEAWQGDEYSKNKWDSSQGDTKDLLPQMVRVTILAWEETPEERLGKDIKPSVQYTTAIYMPYALDFNELRSRNASYSLFK